MSASNIIVRGYEAADLDQTLDLFLLPRCVWGTLRLPYESRDVLRKRIEGVDPNRHLLVATVEGAVTGLLALQRREGRRAHVGAIGLFVHDDHQGRGIGRKLMDACIDLADNWLGLARIELDVFTDNLPAVTLYEHSGFEREGLARNFALRDGVLVDAYYMARLKR